METSTWKPSKESNLSLLLMRAAACTSKSLLVSKFRIFTEMIGDLTTGTGAMEMFSVLTLL